MITKYKLYTESKRENILRTIYFLKEVNYYDVREIDFWFKREDAIKFSEKYEPILDDYSELKLTKYDIDISIDEFLEYVHYDNIDDYLLENNYKSIESIDIRKFLDNNYIENFITKESKENDDEELRIFYDIFEEIKSNDYDNVKECLKYRSLSDIDNDENTPLILASSKSLKIVKLLLKGSDIDERNGENETALFVAVKNNFDDIVKYLIENGADVNTINIVESTPLIQACVGNDFDMIKILVEAGADVNKNNDDGEVALHHTNEEQTQYLIDYYGKNIDLDKKDGYGDSILYKTFIDSDYEKAVILIENGANVIANGIHFLDLVKDNGEDPKIFKDLPFYAAWIKKKQIKKFKI